MFPPDVILVLSKLRADAPAHPGTVSRQKLREHLGKEVEELFEEFEEWRSDGVEQSRSGCSGRAHFPTIKSSVPERPAESLASHSDFSRVTGAVSPKLGG